MSDYIDAAQEQPVRKPEGSPALVPLLALPRRKRGDVLRKLGGLRLRQSQIPDEVESDENTEATPEAENAGLERAAALFDLLADFEDLLRSVAADPDVFDAWVENANDADLSALATFYMKSLQAGEAQASPTS